MHKLIIFFLSLSLTVNLFSQVSSVKGNICDENGTPIGFAPVALLSPVDSTMAFFGISNEQGLFEIKGVKDGKYLLQTAFIGHQTVYKELTVPFSGGETIGAIVMRSKPISLGEVVVEDEHTPMQFRKDTIEYNTAAFKTKPDAVVEDLLKKLPGLEVDRAGNIKAMGEDVKKVLVDGKEFFGSDPKMATRNVPADALRKIQVYNKKSDESEFTGIDDGTRDKTLNLLLKEDRKNAIFGELLGGGGTGSYYQGNGKIYKFSKTNQFAALGMLNNINQFGFSFRDYIDFSGGIQSLGGHGGGVQVKISSGGGSTFPINFGQPVNGLSTSGAGGLNYSHEFKKDSRIFMSYIANGSDRNLLQTTASRNFTEQNSFLQEENMDEDKLDLAQRLNFGLRDRIDSTQNIIINGGASMSYGKTNSKTNSSVFSNESERNRLINQRDNKARQISGNVTGSYIKLIDRGKTVFRLSSDAMYSRDIGSNEWTNLATFFDPVSQITDSQFQDNKSEISDFSATSSITRKIGKFFYLEPELKAGMQQESLIREQGTPLFGNERVDSLSPDFKRQYNWFRPEIRLSRNTEKTQFTLSLQSEISQTSNSLNNDKASGSNHFWFTPGISWEYEYKTGRRLRVYYTTGVNVPTINQLLPVVNISNPIVLSTGNRNLKPELDNSLSLNWWIFDQFSFTSLLTGINATYTRDKINWDRTIDENLRQTMSLINVPDDYSIQGNSDFSTPIRKLGIKINTNLEETWNRGLSIVNGKENINTSLSNRISLSVENRKKTKWDVIAGGAFQMTDAKFSIQESLNNRYLDFSYFTEIQYNPSKHWNFQFTTDVTNYNSKSFSNSVTIPLVGTEVSYYFLKNNRGTFTLQGIDLLNRNTGIERTSELNFLREQRSNMLGRLFMLSFKFRLNKFGESNGGIDVKINKR
jgi:hypothetical protein